MKFPMGKFPYVLNKSSIDKNWVLFYFVEFGHDFFSWFFIKSYISNGPDDDEDMVMEEMNIESLASMRCPITTKPLERAAKANVSSQAFSSKRNNNKY